MSQFKDVALGGTTYGWFAANTVTGTAGDGAIPTYVVRLAGAAAGAAKVYSGTPTLLAHGDYSDGSYEIGIVASAGNGFAAGNEYAVFCSLTISTVNPNGFVGSFAVRAAASTLYELVSAINTLLASGVSIALGGIQSTSFAAGAIDAAALAADAGTEIANAIKAAIVETQGNYTIQQVLSITLSVLAGITSDGGATLKTPNGIATRVAATINAANERTAMTLTPSA